MEGPQIVDAETSQVAIADDGELEDVRRVLETLEVDFVDSWRGDPPESALRISNPRRALEACGDAAAPPAGPRSFHIVILDEDSASMRRELRSGHFDFVVQRPVHPAALRLLIVHALYSGPERRRKARVAMSAEVKLRGGLFPRAATLTQLSEKGCGLISDRKLDVGDRTTLVLPPGLTDAEALSIEGRVVASFPSDAAGGGAHEISVAFRPPNRSVRERLQAVMAAHSVGSGALRPVRDQPPKATPAGSAPSPESAGSGVDRRRSPRKSYCRPVLASAKGAVHTLIGRDLSTGGMRVAGDPRLQEGDDFKLVLYGRGGSAPLVLRAVVARDDGPDGCTLHFRDVGTTVAASLEEMMSSLPQLDRSGSGANVVVSEIIESA